MNKKNPDKAVAEPGSNTIMLVQPDVLARMILADYLRSCGYKVIEGAQAQDVFDILEAGGTIDVILAEMALPGDLDGFGLASQIRRTHPGIDVILPLGIAKAADKAGELCEASPDGQPFHPQEAVRRIKMLRERRRQSKTPQG